MLVNPRKVFGSFVRTANYKPSLSSIVRVFSLYGVKIGVKNYYNIFQPLTLFISRFSFRKNFKNTIPFNYYNISLKLWINSIFCEKICIKISRN